MAMGAKHLPGTKWLRLYWNVSPRGAIVLTEAATTILNQLMISFRLKVLLDTSVRRRDAAVLYLPISLWSSAETVIETVCRRLDGTDDIQSDTPLFTKRICPGVGLAEDPMTGLSFGMHRSGLVAKSLLRSYLRGHSDELKQWTDLNGEFSENGLSLAYAYLNAGSHDIYRFKASRFRQADQL